jgi:ABC-type sugar transport system substrate-binding protein
MQGQRSAAIVGLMAAALVLSACGGSTSSEETSAPAAESPSAAASAATSPSSAPEPAAEPLRIGEVFFSNDPYQVALQTWMEQLQEPEGFTLTACQQADAEKGINCVRDWVTQEYDGIIYAPNDPAASVAVTQEAQAAGVPIVTVAIKPNGVSVPFMEVNEKEQTFEAGAKAATAALELWPDQKVSAVILDLPNLPICADLRMGGFVEGVQSVAPDAEIIRLDGKGTREDSQNVTADTIQSGKAFNIVTACTGEMIQGALSALKSAGRGTATDKVPATEYVFAIDGDRTQAEQLLDPTSPVMQVMGLTPKDNAEKTVQALKRIISGEVPIDSDETVALTAQLLDSDCTAVNDYLTEQFFAEPVACP